MPLEVDALQYLFWTATRPPKPVHTSDSGLDVLKISSMTAVPEPSAAASEARAPAVLFRYHPLNDWESLFWVALYMIFGKSVKPTGNQPQQSCQKRWEQWKLARAFFYEYKTRQAIFSEVPHDCLEDEFSVKLRACLHEDLLPAADLLASVRRELVRAYLAVEADLEAYPDGDTSVHLMACNIVPYYKGIRAHFEKKGDVEVIPMIAMVWGKS